MIQTVEEIHMLAEKLATEARAGLVTEKEELKKEGKASKEEPKKEESKDKYKCIFKNIVVFTNSTDPEKNKSLRILTEAIEKVKKTGGEEPTIYSFISSKVEAKQDGSNVFIWDGDSEVTLKNPSNIDTLVISRLGVQGESDAEHAVKVFQDMGILVLNPVYYSSVACDKYETAKLLEAAKIPQPRFCYMDKDTLYDSELYSESINKLYPDTDIEDKDALEKLDVVVKILDGHGGTGVFTCDCKKLYAILQCIFAVDSKRGLIIQRKELADGGDIRVHVLTLRDKQIILGAMKRVKIGGDFRSNVSLGASAEPIKLTKEQEELALRTAAVSKLPWCAVDIMPLVENSNNELGNNVILEINSSPGTEGISEVLGENFFNILLNALDNPAEFDIQDKVAGRKESAYITFNDDLTKKYLAKLDTGNSTTFNTLEVGEFKVDGDYVKFEVNGEKLKFKILETGYSLNGDVRNERPVITIPVLTIGTRKVRNARIGVVKSRDNKSTNLLINCDTLSRLGYVIHPNKDHLLTPEMEKVKII